MTVEHGNEPDNTRVFPHGGPLASGDEDLSDEKEGELPNDRRLRDVEKSVQETREQMIKGFGDVNTSIERTNSNIESVRSDMISRISDTNKDVTDKVNTAEKDLSDKLNASHTELGNKIGGRSWLIMGILLTALLGGLAVATAILLQHLP